MDLEGRGGVSTSLSSGLHGSVSGRPGLGPVASLIHICVSSGPSQ